MGPTHVQGEEITPGGGIYGSPLESVYQAPGFDIVVWAVR
jgi:hypothetical protein